jgi:hypothetical protein
MALTKVTVTGSWKNENETPATGTVTFTLSHRLTNGEKLLTTLPIVATLNAEGKISLELYATDDAATEPTGQAYVVVVQTSSTSAYTFTAPLTHTIATQDITYLEAHAISEVTVPPALGNEYVTKAEKATLATKTETALLASKAEVTASVAPPLELYADGTTLAERESLLLGEHTFNLAFSAMRKAGSAADFWGGGVFGVVSPKGSNAAANNVGLYAVGYDDREGKPEGGTWGFNSVATVRVAESRGVGAEVDINNETGVEAGSTFEPNNRMIALLLAAGGNDRSFAAIDIDTHVNSATEPGFYYGIRFNQGSTYHANVQSLAPASSHIEWESRVELEANARFQFLTSGELLWGPGGGTAADTYLARTAAATLSTGSFFIEGNCDICSGGAAKTLALFGAGGAKQLSENLTTGSLGTPTKGEYGFATKAEAEKAFAFIEKFSKYLPERGDTA